MIHKFRDIPANLNQRKNIYVLIDEAHRISQRTAGLFQQHHNVLQHQRTQLSQPESQTVNQKSRR
jgi:type I site-specific restriction-modification system R (restriction) subunit